MSTSPLGANSPTAICAVPGGGGATFISGPHSPPRGRLPPRALLASAPPLPFLRLGVGPALCWDKGSLFSLLPVHSCGFHVPFRICLSSSSKAPPGSGGDPPIWANPTSSSCEAEGRLSPHLKLLLHMFQQDFTLFPGKSALCLPRPGVACAVTPIDLSLNFHSTHRRKCFFLGGGWGGLAGP